MAGCKLRNCCNPVSALGNTEDGVAKPGTSQLRTWEAKIAKIAGGESSLLIVSADVITSCRALQQPKFGRELADSRTANGRRLA